MKQRY